MQKKVLSEIDLYQGYVSMPENFEINRKEIQLNELEKTLEEKKIDLDKKIPS